MDSLLIIEDEELLRAELVGHFGEQGWSVRSASTYAEARALLFDSDLDPQVVLSDMSLPGGNALDLLEEIRSRRHGQSQWVFLTGFGSIPDSVRALRLGAHDFLEKPCDLERLDVVLAAAARSSRAHARLADITSQERRRYSPDSFLGRSEAARKTRSLLHSLATAPFGSMLVFGETGTGKGLAARILHYGGIRAGGPLLEVNCAGLPRELLESEMFGHERGSFTGAHGQHRGLLERANLGTLFLDEITEMPVDLQSKLLTAIEDQSFSRVGGAQQIRVDVRILAATNRDPLEAVSSGTLRADLYHRLSAFTLELTPLRERPEDVRDLVPPFVEEFNRVAGKRVETISDAVWERLERHDWPGNVRELRNVVERCVLLSTDETFPEQWLQLKAAPSDGTMAVTSDGLRLPLDGSVTLEEIEREVIRRVLEKHGGNVTAAARTLGTTRETLRYRIRKYGLEVSDDE